MKVHKHNLKIELACWLNGMEIDGITPNFCERKQNSVMT